METVFSDSSAFTTLAQMLMGHQVSNAIRAAAQLEIAGFQLNSVHSASTSLSILELSPE